MHAEILTHFSSASPENESSNLDHLVHLKWLDLSFNNIKAITGLDKLTELMDLNLYNNQVKRRVGCEHLSLRGACTLYAVPTRAIYSRHPSRFLFVRYIRAAPPLRRCCLGRVAFAANIGPLFSSVSTRTLCPTSTLEMFERRGPLHHSIYRQTMTRLARSKDWIHARTSSVCRLGTTASQTWTASFAFVDIPSCSWSTSRYVQDCTQSTNYITRHVRSFSRECSSSSTMTKAIFVQTGTSNEAELLLWFACRASNSLYGSRGQPDWPGQHLCCTPVYVVVCTPLHMVSSTSPSNQHATYGIGWRRQQEAAELCLCCRIPRA